MAKKAIERFIAHAARLDEEEPGEAIAPSRLGKYLKRWTRWLYSGLTFPKEEGNSGPFVVIALAGASLAAHAVFIAALMCPLPFVLKRRGYSLDRLLRDQVRCLVLSY